MLSPLAFIIANLIILWAGWDTDWKLGVSILIGGLEARPLGSAGIGTGGTHTVNGLERRLAMVVGMGEHEVLVALRDVAQLREDRVAAAASPPWLGSESTPSVRGVALQLHGRRDARQGVVQRRFAEPGERTVVRVVEEDRPAASAGAATCTC